MKVHMVEGDNFGSQLDPYLCQVGGGGGERTPEDTCIFYISFHSSKLHGIVVQCSLTFSFCPQLHFDVLLLCVMKVCESVLSQTEHLTRMFSLSCSQGICGSLLRCWAQDFCPQHECQL